ncbi:Vitamin B12 import system permease protein BtuC [Streptomyces violaceorubidus]
MTGLDKPARSQAPADPAAPRARRTTAWLLTAALAAGLLVLVPVAAGTGAYPVPVGDVLGSLLHRAGLGGAELDRVAGSVLWNVRFPRIVLALLVGASLGCAGALMQGVFGNPLAEPGVIGVSSGAAVGAVAALAFGLNFLGTWTVSVFAFVSGLITVLVVYAMSHSRCGCAGSGRGPDAVVVVLHDLALAAAYADRVAVLRSGRIAAEVTPPAEVVRRGAAVRGLRASRWRCSRTRARARSSSSRAARRDARAPAEARP